jgi:hypothetical protein
VRARTASRTVGLAVAAGEDLGQEERVARRAAVELVGVDAVRLGELCDGVGRQSWKLAARDVARPGQLSEDDPQRVAKVELVVAIGAEHERRRRVGLPGQQPHDVEGGLVGPLQVLEDEDRRRAARELAQQRAGHLVRPRVARRGVSQVAAGLLGDVDERPQRARREERVARAPKDPRGPAVLVDEAPCERGLAGAGLAGDEHEAAARAAAHAVEHPCERLELAGALEQVARLCELDRRCCGQGSADAPGGHCHPSAGLAQAG